MNVRRLGPIRSFATAKREHRLHAVIMAYMASAPSWFVCTKEIL